MFGSPKTGGEKRKKKTKKEVLSLLSTSNIEHHRQILQRSQQTKRRLDLQVQDDTKQRTHACAGCPSRSSSRCYPVLCCHECQSNTVGLSCITTTRGPTPQPHLAQQKIPRPPKIHQHRPRIHLPKTTQCVGMAGQLTRK